MHSMRRLLAASLLILSTIGAVRSFGQSTFGSIVGAVRDPTGAGIAGAKVSIQNVDENTTTEVQSGPDGNYQALNLKPATYKVTVLHPGFQLFTASNLELIARQTMRIDATLQVGQVAESILVEGAAPVIASETPMVSSELNTEKVLNLPVNFRASGSTSPYALILTLPGVQSDNGNAFSIQGALPSQSQLSIDGITAQHPRNNAPLREVFPSAETLAEIKVQGIGNTAEYGGVGDVTTVSKSGSNAYHGSAFWYHQNRALDAQAYGSIDKPQKVANDFGFSFGGPVIIPKIYNGTNRTFIFGAMEDFKYPLGQTIQDTVPTEAMRNGDFSAEPYIVRDPYTGAPYANNKIPTNLITPQAQQILTLYPLPNYGGSTSVVNSPNYVTNQRADRPSFQWDGRLDQYFSAKQSFFARWSQKDIDQLAPNNLLLPSTAIADRNRSLVVSHNYTITPTWLNEFRLGFTLENPAQNFPFDGKSFATSLGLKDVGPFLWNGLPDVNIDNFSGLGVGRVEQDETYRTFQINNNTTHIMGRHTIKFGIDVRWLRSKTALGFQGADNFGNFDFGGAFTGSSFADFLLGVPSDTSYGNVTGDNDGTSTHYHAYIQDTFRVTPKLTLDIGLRYELHPPFQDASGNIGNFDRSVPKTGQVVYPSSPEAAKLLAPGLLGSVNACPGTPNLPADSGPGIPGVPCTPFVTAAQAGLPEGLRINYKANFYPRFGFAYRPFNDNNTVVRGSFGMYNMAILGSVFYSLTGTAQTDVRNFTNIGANGQPIFAWPNTRPSGATGVSASDYGSSYFGTANAIDFRNPYSMQYSLSVDRNIGFNTGLRVSYIGLKSTHLPFAPNLNQSPYSTEYYALQPLQNRPYPYWGRIESRDTGGNAFYSALQIEANRRFKSGLTFNAAYTWAKNLNDTGGPNPTGFGGETGNGRIMDSLDRAGSRGNDYATRRHRFISTAVYELPFGTGKKYLSTSSRFANASPAAGSSAASS